MKYTDHKDADISKTGKVRVSYMFQLLLSVINSHIHILTEEKLNHLIIKCKGHTDTIPQPNFYNTLDKYKTKLTALVYYSG